MIAASPNDRSPPSPSMPAHRYKSGPSVRDHLMMNKTFEIDGFTYEVTYEDHRFLFAITPACSAAFIAGYDSFGAYHDDCPARISAPTPQTKTRSILKVKREVMTFIDQVLNEYKPYYFTLYASPEPVASESSWVRYSFYYQVAARGKTGPEVM
jgi:hypothetical protein